MQLAKITDVFPLRLRAWTYCPFLLRCTDLLWHWQRGCSCCCSLLRKKRGKKFGKLRRRRRWKTEEAERRSLWPLLPWKLPPLLPWLSPLPPGCRRRCFLSLRLAPSRRRGEDGCRRGIAGGGRPGWENKIEDIRYRKIFVLCFSTG